MTKKTLLLRRRSLFTSVAAFITNFPAQTRIVVFGTSRINYGQIYTVNSTHASAEQGETGWMLGALTGGRFYLPPGGNKGIVGNTTDQMDTRFNTDVVPLAPLILYMDGPVNDLKGGTRQLSDIQTSMSSIFAKARAAGIKHIFIRNEPASSTITGARETIRVAYNAWLLTLAAPDFTVIDFTGINMADLNISADAVHFTGNGAYYAAKISAAVLNSWATDLTFPTTGNVLTNQAFAGAGVVPTSWSMFDNSGGATIVTSLETRNVMMSGVLTPVVGTKIVVSGTYTGSAKLLNLYQQSATTPAAFTIGDLLEGFCFLQVDAGAVQLSGARLSVLIGGQSSRAGHPSADVLLYPQEAINVLLRSPPVAWATSTGYTCQMSLMFPTVASATAVSVTAWFAQPFLRKVPSL